MRNKRNVSSSVDVCSGFSRQKGIVQDTAEIRCRSFYCTGQPSRIVNYTSAGVFFSAMSSCNMVIDH